jgi:hypothetical protein
MKRFVFTARHAKFLETTNQTKFRAAVSKYFVLYFVNVIMSVMSLLFVEEQFAR